jgi:hypothetical protein
VTATDFAKAVAEIQKQMKHQAEAEVRRLWREEHGLIYVRAYEVQAHVYRRRKGTKRAKVSAPRGVIAEAGKLLELRPGVLRRSINAGGRKR